jgi:hypothetical protein
MFDVAGVREHSSAAITFDTMDSLITPISVGYSGRFL